MQLAKQHRGFTLLEALLYITIAATVLMGGVLFINLILQARIKNQAIAEVEDQGVFITRTLTQALRNAKTITVTPSSMMIQALDGSPMIVTQGTSTLMETVNGSTFALNSPRVLITSSTFVDLTGTSTYKSVQFGFIVSAESQSKRQEFNYSRTFVDSVTLRNH